MGAALLALGSAIGPAIGAALASHGAHDDRLSGGGAVSPELPVHRAVVRGGAIGGRRLMFAESYAEARQAFRTAMAGVARPARLGSGSRNRRAGRGADDRLGGDRAARCALHPPVDLRASTAPKAMPGPPRSAASPPRSTPMIRRGLQRPDRPRAQPLGLSHGHRVDADNVDLSRNFGDFASRRCGSNPDYARIHDAVCPDDWDEGLLGRVIDLFGALGCRMGRRARAHRLTGGHGASHADGLGFGGTQPVAVAPDIRAYRRKRTWSLSAHGLSRMAHRLRRLWPPLGRRARCPRLDSARERMARWWADQDLQSGRRGLESGETPDWSGLLLPGLRRMAPHIDIVGAPIEIGTRPEFRGVSRR